MDNRGFSLVEVMLAVVVLALGLLGVAAGLSSIARLVDASRLETKAALVMESRLEWLRAQAAMLPDCTSPSFKPGSRSLGQGVSESWGVTGAGRGRSIWTSYSGTLNGRSRSDTVASGIWCR